MEPFHQLLTIERSENDTLDCKNTKYDIPKFDSTQDEETNLQSLRKMIGISSARSQECIEKDAENWKPTMTKLLHILCSNREIGNQTVLLASHAFLSLQRSLNSFKKFEKNLIIYFCLQINQIDQFGRLFDIQNIDTFKLVVCYGFLQLNQEMSYSVKIYDEIFEIVCSHCMIYTQYSYFSCRILALWSQKSLRTNFWAGTTKKSEEKLEAVIFSNWDNTICKSNIVTVFAVYLEITKEKYDGFLPYLFCSCVEKISWCHPTKYNILAEICHSMHSNELIPLLTKNREFVSNLISSLTVPHLCNASTKLFLCICNKLSQNEWKAKFGEKLRNHITTWESEREYSALQVLCRYWVEPLVKIHRDIIPFLSECCDENCTLYLSHLLRISRKYGETLPNLDLDSFELLNHEEDFIRLNMFAAHCYAQDDLKNDHYIRSMEAVKNFLFFNATTNSTYLREGVFNYFKIFLSGMLKRASVLNEPKEALRFLEWLYEFEVDCFEIASCYQRKIFGLTLFKLCLQFFYGNQSINCILSKDPVFKAALKYGPLLREQMRVEGKYQFIEKQSLILLLKLVLDSATDVRENSTLIIIEFFDSELLKPSEKSFLLAMAMRKCNSYKFSEAESGACLFKIISKWYPAHNFGETAMSLERILSLPTLEKQSAKYTRILLDEMENQLNFIRNDVLRAATQNSPYYGVVTALLFTTFKSGPESDLATEPMLEEVLTAIEGAVQDFLHLFSSKSSNLDYSSSFKEMGMAVNEAIRRSELNYEFDELILSPVQQLIVTITWRSLKVLCELAVEIVKSKLVTDSMIQRASEAIFTVSLKCRHKGVIESAGYAMGDLTRYLCKNHQKSMRVLEGYVEKLLHNDFAASINLTRRGAGMSTLFHRIVANDIRTERPLFHSAINFLIRSLELRSSTQPGQASSIYDDPRAISLHFLRALVADKQLQAHLNPYLDRVSLICLDYMTSPAFAVRNASSQLYGAVITRLVGQNFGSQSLGFGYGYSVNYFVTHFPQLAAHVLQRLQACCKSFDGLGYWQESASVVYVLPLLSKLFFCNFELVDGFSGAYVYQTKKCLYSLLSNPVSYIRTLAAKCLVALTGTSPSDLAREEHQLKFRLESSYNFNHWNGHLQALEYLIKKNNDENVSSATDSVKNRTLDDDERKNSIAQTDTEYLWNFWNRRLSLNYHLNFAIEAQLLRLSRESKLIIALQQESPSADGSFFNLPSNMRKPGFFEFVDELAKLCVDRLHSNEGRTIIKNVLNVKSIHLRDSFFKIAPRNDLNLLLLSIDFVTDNLEIIDKFVLQNIAAYMNESIRSLLFHERMRMCDFDVVTKLENVALQISKNVSNLTRQLTVLLTYIRSFSCWHSKTFDPLKCIITGSKSQEITLAHHSTHPETVRESLSKSLEIFLLSFDDLNSECKRKCLLLSLTLLKDEIASIRETTKDSLFSNIILPYNLSKTRVSSEIVQTLLLLNLISRETIVGHLSHKQFTGFITEYFSTTTRASSTLTLENPFDDDDITCFREESKLINIIVYCFEKRLSRSDHFADKERIYSISDFVFSVRQNLLKKMSLDSNNLQDFLNMKPDQYQSRKLETVVNLYINKV